MGAAVEQISGTVVHQVVNHNTQYRPSTSLEGTIVSISNTSVPRTLKLVLAGNSRICMHTIVHGQHAQVVSWPSIRRAQLTAETGAGGGVEPGGLQRFPPGGDAVSRALRAAGSRAAGVLCAWCIGCGVFACSVVCCVLDVCCVRVT